jgi:FkbM family methyltransferase
MKELMKKMLKIINRLVKSRKLFYYIPGKYSGFGNTAVKTKFGFWYVGNVLDERDIACGILNFGVIEEAETNLVLKIYAHLKDRSANLTIFDIGANTGYYGLLAANYFGPGAVQVYSFEPVSEFADCIRESARLNRFDQAINVCNYALSDKAGEADIYVSGTCTSMEKDFNNEELPARKIATKRLDDVVGTLADGHPAKPQFIKMDVEGHELRVLKGAMTMLRENLPVLFIEIVNQYSARKSVNALYAETIETLTKIGYTAYSFHHGKLCEISTDKPNDIDGVCMYLFLHPDRHMDLIKILK